GIDGYKYSVDDLSDNEYRYLIIDLQASNLDFHPEGIHLHLNNAKIYVHSIFFADTVMDFELSETPESEVVYDPTFDIDGTSSGYVYNYIGLDNAAYADYLILNVSGNVASLRFQFINQDESVTSDFYFLSDLTGINGVPLFYEANTTETQTLIIDLKASGIEQNIGAMHVHYGDDDPTADDIMSFHSIELVNRADKEPEIETEALGSFAPTEGLIIDATTSGYVYNYAGMDNPVLADVMEIVINGNAESIRLQFINNDESVTSATYFLSDLIGIDGNPLLYLPTTETEQTLLIDLKASGINQNIQAFHIHYGDGDPTADDVVTIHSISFYNFVNQKIDEATVNEVYSPVDPFIIDATADAYVYNYVGLDTALTTERYLEITVQGNISSLRLQGISVGETFTSATYFLSDLIGVDGDSLEFIPNTSEPQTLIIDLYASGLGFNIAAFHLHYGDDDPTADDVMSIINMKVYMQNNALEDLDTAIGE
ncbi:MAG: hypothetical protein K9L64_05605, partial [Candidatus Izimaplasma sp.]|nr:hypothetical protein [Candidatus Izimaplasma bacterium]